MNAQTTNRLQEIFRAVFELPTGAEVGVMEQTNTPAWDSLAHVYLVTAIENEFGVSLDAVDQLQMTSYTATAQMLHDRGV